MLTLNADREYWNPEPVPAASQFAVLPFLAAVAGLLGEGTEDKKLRVTIHRVMTREKKGYLQQVCGYLGFKEKDWQQRAGRLFPVTFGIMGHAFGKRKICRTKPYPNEKQLKQDLESDMAKTGDTREVEDVALSYLAVPFLGPSSQVVLVLYADCWKFNFFADDERIHQIRAMSDGWCHLLDWLQEEPFSNLRNFPLESGEPFKGPKTVYPKLQEALKSPAPPRFRRIESFNYEASPS